ncbi:ABC-2 type transporter-domain-containing protein [Chytridium lagenaria]|nr:ABC-2 type transporter-domain-containing protein [Chytridium lagenaria]
MKKVVVVGNEGVGKTLLIQTRISSHSSSHDSSNDDDVSLSKTMKTTLPTVMEESYDTLKQLGYVLTDTAGSEALDRLRPFAYENATSFIICFSVWVPEINCFCPGVPFTLVACQADQRDNPRAIAALKEFKQLPVSTLEGEEMALRIGARILYRFPPPSPSMIKIPTLPSWMRQRPCLLNQTLTKLPPPPPPPWTPPPSLLQPLFPEKRATTTTVTSNNNNNPILSLHPHPHPLLLTLPHPASQKNNSKTFHLHSSPHLHHHLHTSYHLPLPPPSPQPFHHTPHPLIPSTLHNLHTHIPSNPSTLHLLLLLNPILPNPSQTPPPTPSSSAPPTPLRRRTTPIPPPPSLPPPPSPSQPPKKSLQAALGRRRQATPSSSSSPRPAGPPASANRRHRWDPACLLTRTFIDYVVLHHWDLGGTSSLETGASSSLFLTRTLIDYVVLHHWILKGRLHLISIEVFKIVFSNESLTNPTSKRTRTTSSSNNNNNPTSLPQSTQSLTKSVDSLRARQNRRPRPSDIIVDAPPEQGAPLGPPLGVSLSTGHALSPAASRFILAASRDGLGSSFQLTHVVPEENEEASTRVPTRVPSSVQDASVLAAAIAAQMEKEEVGRIVDAEEVVGRIMEEEEGDRIMEEEEVERTTEEEEQVDIVVRIPEEEEPNETFIISSPSDPEISQTTLPLFDDTRFLTPGNADLNFFKSDEDLMQMAFGTVGKHSRAEVVMRELRYEVDGKMGRREILKGVTGCLRSGKLTAIMGASGAGKTSLLNVIAGETRTGKVSGNILINSKPVTGEELRNLSGFVFQDDVIYATMTVREAISMSAHLRLPETLSETERQARVDEMIESLNLRKAANTPIGTILFLDEPTSGLDSFTALSVIRTLKALAGTGRTVIATLHQPSSEIFSPLNSNPTDYFFMSILNNEPTAFPTPDTLSSTDRITHLLTAWTRSPEHAKVMKRVENQQGRGIPDVGKRTMRSAFTQIAFLYGRASRNAIRDPLVVRSKAVQVAFTSLLIGLLYWRTDEKMGSVAVQNRLGVLFFMSVSNLMTSSTANLSVFAREKAVFLREHSAGYYRVTPYFIAKFFAELPLYVLFPCIQTIIVYFMVGLQSAANKVIIACVATIMSGLVGMALGIFFACAFSSIQVALLATPLVMMPMMLFSGMFVNTASMPKWISWLQYLSPVRYCFEGLVKNEFQGLVLLDTNPLTSLPRTYRGEQQLAVLGFEGDGLLIEWCILILVAMTLGLVGGAYLGLIRLTRTAHMVSGSGKGRGKVHPR